MQPGSPDALAASIRDFLRRLDAGFFGDLRIGPAHDRSESAVIIDMREQLAAFEAGFAPSRREAA
ncbi:hypothetical protein [Methylobacterium organophilum]|uniref:Uncharacterized protein n=1 Tax=Methylobacterium organophilum TaxID=410 RepID=A0ABQ4TEX9_METOR|nr:hypothetical protein [Methylobacterium organophilum]GJE29768.1 hypothetical protein LKMONMHP_4654 [Methylobacterium organophilum]